MTTNTQIGNFEIANQHNVISQRRAALVAGFSLLTMFFMAIFANFFVIEGLVVPDDAGETAVNILANESLFRMGIVAFIIVLICDVLVAWGLYEFFKPVNQSVSLLAASFRLVYTAMFAANLFHLVNALHVITDSNTLAKLGTDMAQVEMMVSLNSFSYGWLFGLVFFGFHLLVLGYLAIKSGSVPKIISILLLLAGFGYILDSFAHLLLSNYADYAAFFLIIVAVPGTVGELGLCLWLLFRGGKKSAQLAKYSQELSSLSTSEISS